MFKARTDTEIRVGLFVSLGVGLLMVAILTLGGIESLLHRQVKFISYFEEVSGLIPGAKVVLNGIRVGMVDEIAFDSQRQAIRVEFRIFDKYIEWIRIDSTASIDTQGVLGDKFIALSAGTVNKPNLEAGGEIANAPTKNLSEFLSDGEKLIVKLNSIATSLDSVLKAFERQGRADKFFQGLSQTSQNLAEATDKFNKSIDATKINRSLDSLDSILNKINRGDGTLGALINDPALYQDTKNLLGGVNRNRIMKNLIRKTIKDSEEEEQPVSKTN